MVIGKGYTDRLLTESEVREIMSTGLEQANLAGKRVLIIIPDGTRSGPVNMFFRLFHELLWGKVAALDYLIALGTHQPMSEEAIHHRLGVTAEEMAGRYAGVNVYNHKWDDPDTFRTLGTIPASEIHELTNGLFAQDVPVAVNKMIFDYDQVIICGPVFPHEVVGFSGGNKYFFPGISGWEMIDFTHWLGAVMTSFKIIGTKDTPVRAVIDRAAAMIDMPKLCFGFVVKDDGVAGLFVASPEEAWSHAADLSAKLHIVYVDKPYRQVLSIMPEMYDDIWTAAKGMYKLEPVVEDGGEVIIYAPHITELSYTHGRILDEIGYHVRDYFLKQWDKFKHYPWGVLAHSTHLRGMGTYENGVEKPRIKVTLATGIPRERCERVNLGYRDPATIDPEEWMGREDEGILVVPHAGEMLYRLKGQKP
ncbi:MAG: DUF2088 domain-containing protein [Anaerolineae bacterium]|nr:DUF2088 domain-containing protein [Anaerolineae bacterium]